MATRTIQLITFRGILILMDRFTLWQLINILCTVAMDQHGSRILIHDIHVKSNYKVTNGIIKRTLGPPSHLFWIHIPRIHMPLKVNNNI